MNWLKRSVAASLASVFVGLNVSQAWAVVKISNLPSQIKIQTPGIAWPMSGLTFRGKMDHILWDQGLSATAPKLRPGESSPAPTNTDSLKQAAQSSQDLSKDLKNSSDDQAKQKSDEIFGMRPDAFEHQLGHVMTLVNDVPVERLHGKAEVASHIKKSLKEARENRLVLSTKYLPYGPMRQEVALSAAMEAPLLQMEKLAAKTEKSSGGKEEFVKKFYKSLARLGKKWLKKVRAISGSEAR